MPHFISPLDWTASLGLILVYPPLMGFSPRLQIRSDRLSREMESGRMHMHFACFPTNHPCKKASSIISSNSTGVRNKGKESRVKSNFNIQKKRDICSTSQCASACCWVQTISNKYLNDNSHHWKVQSLSWHRRRPLINLIAHCRDTGKEKSLIWRSIQLIQLVLRVLPI